MTEDRNSESSSDSLSDDAIEAINAENALQGGLSDTSINAGDDAPTLIGPAGSFAEQTHPC